MRGFCIKFLILRRDSLLPTGWAEALVWIDLHPLVAALFRRKASGVGVEGSRLTQAWNPSRLERISRKQRPSAECRAERPQS
jgi:hypothetical protein